MKKLALLLALLLLLPLTALANDFPVMPMAHIIRSYPEDASITFLQTETHVLSLPSLPRIFWRYELTDVTLTDESVLLAEYELGSVAKGAEMPLETGISDAYFTRMSGASQGHLDGLLSATYGMNNMMTVTVPAGMRLTGPSEDSPCNSRLYVVRVYGQRYTMSGMADPWIGRTTQVTAECVTPRVWLLYAVDVYIPPMEETP